MMPGIHMIGPLGKSSLQDDEREAALRKNPSFCLGLLAVLNCLANPLSSCCLTGGIGNFAQTASVVTTAFMLNATLLGCLPTLYASWNLRQLPNE